MSNTYIKCISFYVFKFYFKNYATLLIYFSNLIYMYFRQGLKNLNIQKMIYHHFKKNLLKIEIFCLLVYRSIVVKMDHFHLFEKVLTFFLTHRWQQW
jgi:hypothetical protein